MTAFTFCQQQSEHFVNLEQRLDRLRKAKGLTWKELANAFALSRTMLHYVRKRKRDLGVKKNYQLLQMERDAGLETREEEVLSAVSRAASVSKMAGEKVIPTEIFHEELRGLKMADEAAHWKKRAEISQRRLTELERGMRKLLDANSTAGIEAEVEAAVREGEIVAELGVSKPVQGDAGERQRQGTSRETNALRAPASPSKQKSS